MSTMVARTLHWAALDLDLATRDALEEHLEAFVSELKAMSYRPKVELAPASEWMLELLDSTESKALIDVNADLFDELVRHERWQDKLLIACEPSSPLARLALSGSKDALWGASFKGGPLALVYGNFDRYVIWHEALHLFSADDCYDLPDRGPNCGEPRCIMQYEPTRLNTGPGLQICDANRSVIRRSFVREGV